MGDQYIGEIRLFPYNFIPMGWAACDGSLLNVSANAALYSLLGTTYGGNGTSTFGLPDLRSRVPVGVGQGTGLSRYTLGEIAGAETVTLNAAQAPSHNHTINVSTANASTSNPQNAYPAAPNYVVSRDTTMVSGYGTAPTSNVTLAAGTVNPNAGGGQPHNNLQPVLGLQYCIATEGVYPTRQ